MARIIAIWIFGLLGSGAIGSLIGETMQYDGAIIGFFAGVFSFTCIRLWLAGPSNKNSN